MATIYNNLDLVAEVKREKTAAYGENEEGQGGGERWIDEVESDLVRSWFRRLSLPLMCRLVGRG